jgi:DNA-binding protein HU-beta
MSTSKRISKADLVDSISAEVGITKAHTKSVIDSFLGEIQSAVSQGDSVALTGFGTFELRRRKERSGVKPGTTERIKIPASDYPAFKAGKAFKEACEKTPY